jgi:hypothetical protein
MKGNTPVILLTTLVALSACRGREGTHPEDMSVAEHEAAAERAEAKAVAEEAEYDPDPIIFGGTDCIELCFRTNPTEHHLRAANQLRREAAAHREASYELRVAEERACSGIPELHRDFSPFYHTSHILGAELGDEGPIVVHFDRIPKTTVEGLQQLVDCHMARNAALGFDMPEMDFCPLAIRDVSAEVVEAEQGFDVRLGAKTDEARAEVKARVEALLEGRASGEAK